MTSPLPNKSVIQNQADSEGAAAVQPLHQHETYHEGRQSILVIGETGSGKSTFIQYMLVSDISAIDSRKIQASVHSVTDKTHTYESPRIVIPSKGRFSATFVDTVGFNALDIDANRVFNELHDQVRFSEAIHKILIVHKLGRSRKAVVADTQRTIQLLARLGARPDNVYVTITFAYDYSEEVRARMLQEVKELYQSGVLVKPENVFFSDYVLLSEINPLVHQHYEQRIRNSHNDIVLKIIVERVEPFKPLVNTFRAMEKKSHVRWAERAIFAILILFCLVLSASLPLIKSLGQHREIGDYVIFFIFAMALPGLLSWIAYHR